MRASPALWAALLAATLSPRAAAAGFVPAAADSDGARPALAVAVDDTVAAPPADSLAAFDLVLRRLAADAAKLDPSDRRVLDELTAAARELHEAGDLEAARLAVADAIEFARQRLR